MPGPLQLESITRSIEYRDPILLFHHLCRQRKNGLLLESAEIDSKRHLNSFLLISAALRIVCRGNQVSVKSMTEQGKSVLPLLAKSLSVAAVYKSDDELVVTYGSIDADLDEDSRLLAISVFEPLRKLIEMTQINSSLDEALFIGGLFGYDLVECFEPLPQIDDPGICPNYVFYVAQQLIHLDHQNGSGQLIGTYFYDPFSSTGQSDREAFEAEVAKTQSRCQNLSLLDLPPSQPVSAQVETNKTDSEFIDIVNQLKTKINHGEVFQIVPSRCFSMPCTDELRTYRRLRKLNPSPYMFYMQDEDFTLLGASPEMSVKFTAADRQVEVCPIAGTRRRGKNADGSINRDLDSRVELELRTDNKEMAEHLMLVDLARNDLARICSPGSRHIAQLLKVDRYSHVMHLVSRLVGRLKDGLDALHAYQACMNMGTLRVRQK